MSQGWSSLQCHRSWLLRPGLREQADTSLRFTLPAVCESSPAALSSSSAAGAAGVGESVCLLASCAASCGGRVRSVGCELQVESVQVELAGRKWAEGVRLQQHQ